MQHTAVNGTAALGSSSPSSTDAPSCKRFSQATSGEHPQPYFLARSHKCWRKGLVPSRGAGDPGSEDDHSSTGEDSSFQLLLSRINLSVDMLITAELSIQYFGICYLHLMTGPSETGRKKIRQVMGREAGSGTGWISIPYEPCTVRARENPTPKLSSPVT